MRVRSPVSMSGVSPARSISRTRFDKRFATSASCDGMLLLLQRKCLANELYVVYTQRVLCSWKKKVKTINNESGSSYPVSFYVKPARRSASKGCNTMTVNVRFDCIRLCGYGKDSLHSKRMMPLCFLFFPNTLNNSVLPVVDIACNVPNSWTTSSPLLLCVLSDAVSLFLR